MIGKRKYAYYGAVSLAQIHYLTLHHQSHGGGRRGLAAMSLYVVHIHLYFPFLRLRAITITAHSFSSGNYQGSSDCEQFPSKQVTTSEP